MSVTAPGKAVTAAEPAALSQDSAGFGAPGPFVVFLAVFGPMSTVPALLVNADPLGPATHPTFAVAVEQAAIKQHSHLARAGRVVRAEHS